MASLLSELSALNATSARREAGEMQRSGTFVPFNLRPAYNGYGVIMDDWSMAGVLHRIFRRPVVTAAVLIGAGYYIGRHLRRRSA